MISEILIPAIIFFATYHIIRILSDHLLKRKIIKSGHIEKADILSQTKVIDEESNKYPSLKWGLVAFLAGTGLIIIELVRINNPELINEDNPVFSIGLELVFISLGFLIYFFFVNFRNKK